MVMVAALGAGWAGWHWVARPASIEQRMPMAAGAGTGSSAGARSTDPGSQGSPGSASGESGGSAGGGTESTSDAADDRVVVHVAGSVVAPGVITLEPGARVGDAVSAAGGLAPGADADVLNLAALLTDGERVFVPQVGQEVPPELTIVGAQPPGSDPTPAVVDLNRADAAALEALPGIGPATAAAILDHRERNGDFASVEDLMDVRGIGEAKFAALDGLITVS